jgi:O-antigen ligase
MIGVSIYIVTVTISRDRRRLEASLRWLYIALGITLFLSVLQICSIVFEKPLYDQLNEIQRMFSLRNLRKGRVSGFAYEPSWFADQLVVLWIPFVLGGLLAGNRILSTRRYGILFEILLLIIASAALAFTYSRGGVASFLFSVGLTFILVIISRWRKILDWLTAADNASELLATRLATATLRLSVSILGLVGTLVGVGRIFSRSSYFSLVWERSWLLEVTGDFARYLASIGADIRVALSLAGWEVFLRNPIIGVGLGQSGFYLLDHLPSWTRESSVLTASLFSPFSMQFPNPKNLWIRLLSETGLLGTTFFIVFMVVMLACAIYMAGKRDRLMKHIGLAGVISWLAIVVEGFSLDSFALPTMWIALGLVTSGVWLLHEKDRNELEIDRI